MYKLFFFSLMSIFITGNHQLNAQVTTQWGIGIAGTGNQNANEVTVDKQGNTIVVGALAGSNVDFDPSFANFNLTSAGSDDIFVAKYSSAGALIFAFRVGGTDNDAATNVAVDSAGNIYVSGWFRGTVDFNPGSGVNQLTSNGDNGFATFGGDAFLVKYSSSGAYLWALNVGSSSILDSGGKIYINDDQSVMWGGSFTGSNVDFDPSSSTSTVNSPGTTSSFFAKYSSEGAFQFVKAFGGSTVQNCALRDIVKDSNGNFYILGHFDGTIDANPDAGINNLPTNGCGDAYVIKLTSTGTYIWGFNLGGSNCDYPWAMAIDQSNNIYLTGQLASVSADFNPSSTVSNFISTSGGLDVFLAKYSQNGDYQFAHSIGGTSNDAGYTLAIKNNSLVVGGYFSSSVDFDNGPAVSNFTASGLGDAFIMRYNLTGGFQGGFKIGGSNSANLDFTRSMIFSSQSEIVTAGTFWGNNVNVDASGNSASQILVSSGANSGVFVAKYDLNISLPSNFENITGELIETKSKISWTVTNEVNVDEYELEYSVDAISFTSIDRVKAKNATGNTSTYFLYHHSPKNGDNFYRIKTIDKDGSFKYSRIVSVKVQLKALVNIYPNPVNNILSVEVSKDLFETENRIVARILNNSGQVIIQAPINSTLNTINVASLIGGSYFIELFKTNGERIIVQRFIKY